MGFLSHILFGDFGQSLDIEKTRSEVKEQAMQQARNTSKLFNAGIEIDRLKRQNGERWSHSRAFSSSAES